MNELSSILSYKLCVLRHALEREEIRLLTFFLDARGTILLEIKVEWSKFNVTSSCHLKMESITVD